MAHEAKDPMRNAPVAPSPAHMAPKAAIVIVTYNRPDFLKGLLESIAALAVKPGYVIVVDNNSREPTRQILAQFQQETLGFTLLVKRLDKNIGGAGGFSVGVEEALKTDADWFWLMDDDVVVLPDGLEKMLRWTDRFRCFHAGRQDSDGSHFFCEQWVSNALAVQLPFLKEPYRGRDYFLTNYGCFEGMMIHRDIVGKIGLPDRRFFIVWDDAIYGWLAARETEVAFIADECLQKVRRQRQISLGLRHLNDASDLSRYYAMRNRALIKGYFKAKGVYVPLAFELGSCLVFLKEVVRMVMVERSLKGMWSLIRGVTGQGYRSGKIGD